MANAGSSLLIYDLERFLLQPNFGKQSALEVLGILEENGIPAENRNDILALVTLCRDQVVRAREQGLREGLETLERLLSVQGSGSVVQIQAFCNQFHQVTNMGSKYRIEGGQQGAVGDNADVHDNVFNQQAAWAEVKDSGDLPQLAGQLALILAEMRHVANDPEQFDSMAQVARAEKAAIAGDGPGVIVALKAAGKWVLDFTSKVGASLVAEFMKKTLFPGSPT
ncbi:MAG: hypothetical protein ACLP7Q_27055 [Isosphaeraceae bacterium]